MELFLVILTLILVAVSNVFFYRLGKRKGYGVGAMKVLGEWKKYLNQMEDK